MRYIIAFDVGTTAVKVVCIDRQTGKLTTDLATEFQSKNELGDGYGMRKASSICSS